MQRIGQHRKLVQNPHAEERSKGAGKNDDLKRYRNVGGQAEQGLSTNAKRVAGKHRRPIGRVRIPLQKQSSEQSVQADEQNDERQKRPLDSDRRVDPVDRKRAEGIHIYVAFGPRFVARFDKRIGIVKLREQSKELFA